MILMSKQNPNGHKLEDLLEAVSLEIEGKNLRLSVEGSAVAARVARNNAEIVYLLKQALALQRNSLAALDTLGPDQGPQGTPRL